MITVILIVIIIIIDDNCHESQVFIANISIKVHKYILFLTLYNIYIHHDDGVMSHCCSCASECWVLTGWRWPVGRLRPGESFLPPKTISYLHISSIWCTQTNIWMILQEKSRWTKNYHWCHGWFTIGNILLFVLYFPLTLRERTWFVTIRNDEYVDGI